MARTQKTKEPEEKIACLLCGELGKICCCIRPVTNEADIPKRLDNYMALDARGVHLFPNQSVVMGKVTIWRNRL